MPPTAPHLIFREVKRLTKAILLIYSGLQMYVMNKKHKQQIWLLGFWFINVAGSTHRRGMANSARKVLWSSCISRHTPTLCPVKAHDLSFDFFRLTCVLILDVFLSNGALDLLLCKHGNLKKYDVWKSTKRLSYTACMPCEYESLRKPQHKTD